MTKNRWMFIALLVLAILIVCRIVAAISMNSFFIDETARAGLVRAILDPNTPIAADHFGMFFVKTDADASTAGFFIPATIWAFFFSDSIISLRLFACLSTIVGCILLGKAISYWYKNSNQVWAITTIVAMLLPWNFLQGMLFWDATLAPVFIIISLLAFSYLYNQTSKTAALSRPTFMYIAQFVALPTGLVLAAGTYKPAAFLAVSLYIIFLICLIRRKIYTLKHTAITLAISCVFASPIVLSILTWQTALARSREISVFAVDNPATQIKIIFENFQKLLSPDFLFASGDLNRRHSTGTTGMIGYGAIIPILSAIYFRIRTLFGKNENFLFLISIIGIGLSYLGSALTVESPPHGLRANSAWLFFAIIISIGIIKLYSLRKSKIAKLLLITAAVILLFNFVYYFRNFWLHYLPNSIDYFSTPEINIEKLYFVKIYMSK